MDHVPRRLAKLPVVALPCGLTARSATTGRARLLGLAGLRDLSPGCALHLPRTRSVHTFWMRHRLDLVWLDRGGHPIRVDRAVAPRRVRVCARASAVVERVHPVPAGP